MTQTIALLSDSTGNLGEHFARALMSQFPKDAFDLQVHSFISNKADLKKILNQLEGRAPIVFHTTVMDAMKADIKDAAHKRGWHEYDLTGTAMAFLEKSSGRKASPNIEAVHELNPDYERRMAAIDFTLRHDDGLSVSTLKEADIVLMGVSRTSKTPTSVYLANKGYKVANVPIVPGIPLHERVRQHPHLHVAGLTIDPDKLFRIRYHRAKQEKIPDCAYYDLEAIKEELKEARSFFVDIGCPVIDVTNHAVEETAALVLKELHLR